MLRKWRPWSRKELGKRLKKIPMCYKSTGTKRADKGEKGEMFVGGRDHIHFMILYKYTWFGRQFVALLWHFTEGVTLTLCFCRRLINRLDDMKKTVCGDGMSHCLLCGEQFGSPRVSSVVCEDCKKVSQSHFSAALHTIWNTQKVMYHELSTCEMQMSSHIP